jgi:hypothetical protein
MRAAGAAPWTCMDAAIVVAFANRFEFVAEDHPDPMSRLNFLQEQGGLSLVLAGVKPSTYTDRAFFFAHVFQEYEGQAWAHHRSMRSAELSGATP